MNKENISTSDLLQKLFKTKNIKKLIRNFDNYVEYVSFSAYINHLCAEREKTPAKIIKESTIERSYGHQLFSGKRTPSRDKVIQLAFGFEMDYFETQSLLKAARKSQLFPRIKRDAVIIYALKNEYKIVDLQATLDELGLPLLGKEERTYE